MDAASAIRFASNELKQIFPEIDWDEKGWASFVSDPEVPPIMKEAGHQGRPQVATLGGRCFA